VKVYKYNTSNYICGGWKYTSTTPNYICGGWKYTLQVQHLTVSVVGESIQVVQHLTISVVGESISQFHTACQQK